MKIVTTSYVNTKEFTEPLSWLQRIDFHTGTLEQLALKHEVISVEQINFSGQVMRNGVSYQFLNFKKPKIYWPYRLHQFIKTQKPDVVMVHGLHFPLQLMQLRKTVGRKVKIIVQHHAEKPHHGWRRRLQRLADKMVDAYLFASRELGKEWIDNKVIRNKKKVVEVIAGSSVFYSPPSHRNQNNGMVYLWVGRLDNNKDPLTVVEAFTHFLKEEPEARLQMIFHEDALLPQIRELIQHRRIQNVELIAKVPHQELERWYHGADFFISGSHYESSGIAACEAMSCGCIPILTDIPSFRKMTGHGKCGLLYRPGNVSELLIRLQQSALLNIREEQEKTIRQFEKELSFKAIAQCIDRLINKLAQT